jgi:hypothetical protein
LARVFPGPIALGRTIRPMWQNSIAHCQLATENSTSACCRHIRLLDVLANPAGQGIFHDGSYG